ncbi:sorting nexin-6 [Patella vulgata]|uniref:sorting nexin-6 n=1 Tax=Patella vulgata TaxID=6465 RepID=UPI0024A86902|nr:sorting nexin-6 [Patella vulgata]
MQREDSSEYDISSSDSSPGKDAIFTPLFTACLSDAVKDGDTLQFTVMATRAGEETGTIVNRQYEDIEWLHHCLTTQNNVDGVIIPPLPTRPDVDARSAENKSKQQLGNDTKVLKPDDFNNDCQNVEGYLKMILNHPAFGRDVAVEKFLCDTVAPVRSKLKKGLLSKFTDAVEEVRKGNHRDIDEYFQKKREWAAEYSKIIKETSTNFDKMVHAQLRLSCSYGNLAAEVTVADGTSGPDSTKLNRIMYKFSHGLDNERRGLEMICNYGEITLGHVLDLYTRYMESVRSMLYRRTCLLLNYEEANKNFEKAKVAKRQAAEEAKIEAEKKYEDCTDTARIELKSFLQQRILAFGEILTKFTELQLKSSRETYTLLHNSLTTVQQLEV